MSKAIKKEDSVNKSGLGDIVEKTIKKVAPKVADKYKDCNGCEVRKEGLNKLGRYIKNNFNAIFS